MKIISALSIKRLDIVKGAIFTAWTGVFGQSKTSRKEDEQYRDAHYAKTEEKQKIIIAKARALRAAYIQKAENKVNQARSDEAKMVHEYYQAIEDLNLGRDRLADAKADLAKASADLKRLGAEKLELVTSSIDIAHFEVLKIVRTKSSIFFANQQASSAN